MSLQDKLIEVVIDSENNSVTEIEIIGEIKENILKERIRIAAINQTELAANELKETAKAALLAKLGITADEAALLLS